MHVKTFGISKQSLNHGIPKVCKNDQRRSIKRDDIPGKAINDEKYLSMSILLRFAITVAYNQNPQSKPAQNKSCLLLHL